MRMTDTGRINDHGNAAINITGAALILAAAASGALSSGLAYKLIRNGSVLMLLALWAMAIRRRVVLRRTRDCLLGVAFLEIFWVSVRLIKFEFLTAADTMRYAWYLYYLPMLMIPVFCLFLAISMGKSDAAKPAGFLIIFPVFSVLLFLLVMTNDLHSLVFKIPSGLEGLSVGNYSYSWGFFVIQGYIWLCALASFGIILTKCRLPGKRFQRVSPLLPLIFAGVVSVMNALGLTTYFGFYKIDITVVVCVCATITLEMCIQNGLILSNSRYDELFRISGVRAMITDNSDVPLISSDTCGELSEEDIKAARGAPVQLGNGMRLSSAPIRRGRVLWQDDLSELHKILDELAETSDYLQGKSAAIQQAYAYRKREQQLVEKNRLYNRVLTQTRSEIECYAGLVEQLASETDRGKAKALAVKTAFVSAFIKRRDNLIFLSEQGKRIDARELAYCVEESLSNLRLGGMECSCSCELSEPLEFGRIASLYESFYTVMFTMIDDASAVCVYLIEENGEARIEMRVTPKDGAEFSEEAERVVGVSVGNEDGDRTVSICG